MVRKLGDANYKKEEARRWAREQLAARRAAQDRIKKKEAEKARKKK